MKLRYLVVGSGWRSLFYARIADLHPEAFEMCAMLCRGTEKAKKLNEEYGIHTTTSIEECEAMNPDFVVVAVNKTSICDVAAEWAQKGYPVLMETPAALTLDGLNRLWKLKTEGARIQVAEQYTRYPMIAAALNAVKDGRLGDPYAVNLSAVHDYHAASLIRSFLKLDVSTPMKVYGHKYTFPVVETDSRYGAVTDGSVKERDRVRMTFKFENGKVGFYDFSGVQYHSYIRSRHLNVQGMRGELDDFNLRYVNESNCLEAREMEIRRADGGVGIERVTLGDEILYTNPFTENIMPQDETAIAGLMMDMGRYIEDGTEAYPLAEALQDAYTLILMNQALERPGSVICSEPQIWQNER